MPTRKCETVILSTYTLILNNKVNLFLICQYLHNNTLLLVF